MKFIVLDRDGVINQDSDAYVKTIDEWVPIPGSLEAIARLNHDGYRVLIASNQSGLARGLLTIDDLHAMHGKMHRELARLGGQVEAIFFCPHAPEQNCDCRKPRPGLLRDVGRRLHLDLAGIPVVGDSLRDIQAAQAVGASPILVLTGKGRQTFETFPAPLEGIPRFPDLSSVVDALLLS